MIITLLLYYLHFILIKTFYLFQALSPIGMAMEPFISHPDDREWLPLLFVCIIC